MADLAQHSRPRILVYRTGQIGDTLIALPAMWAIRQHFPSAYLCLLTGKHRKSNFLLATEVLPREGLFDDILTYPTDLGGVGLSAIPKALLKIRRHHFDTLVYLAPRIRTPKQVNRDLAFFRLAGIRHFIGHEGIEPLPVRLEGNQLETVEHETDHLLERLAVSGIPIPSPEHRTIQLQLSESEHKHANTWLAAHVGQHLGQVPIVAFGPGSKFLSKMWPEERFLELGKLLIDRLGIYPIIFGGPEDREVGQRLISQWGIGLNAAGKLSVRQSAAAMMQCALYIGNDTGTMHLAAAGGVPCVAIFSAIDWPGRWYPYGSGHTILRNAVPCEGCQLEVCSEHDLICLRQIEVKDVLAAVESKLIGSRLVVLPLRRTLDLK
jgi:heptosyltransferase III